MSEYYAYGPNLRKLRQLLEEDWLIDRFNKYTSDDKNIGTISFPEFIEKTCTERESYLYKVFTHATDVWAIIDNLHQAIIYSAIFPQKIRQVGINRSKYLSYHRSSYLNNIYRLRERIAHLINVWLKIGLDPQDVKWGVIFRNGLVIKHKVQPILGRIKSITNDSVELRNKDVHRELVLHVTAGAALAQEFIESLPGKKPDFQIDVEAYAEEFCTQKREEVSKVCKELERLWKKMIEGLRG